MKDWKQDCKKTNQKHPIQQNSIIANMDLMGLLSNSFLYLEFGAGKGELLRYLNQCILQQKQNVHALMVLD